MRDGFLHETPSRSLAHARGLMAARVADYNTAQPHSAPGSQPPQASPCARPPQSPLPLHAMNVPRAGRSAQPATTDANDHRAPIAAGGKVSGRSETGRRPGNSRLFSQLGAKPRKGDVRAILRKTVIWFNEADEEAGNVIETEEREDICVALEEMAYAARQKAFVDEIDDWREWQALPEVSKEIGGVSLRTPSAPWSGLAPKPPCVPVVPRRYLLHRISASAAAISP